MTKHRMLNVITFVVYMAAIVAAALDVFYWRS